MSTVGSFSLILILAASLGVLGLRDVQVTVPEAAAAGETVTLVCRYDLESDSLYSVKWYKGRQEFFRYIPKELPHTRVFALDGAEIDVGRSGPAAVVLRNVTTLVSGRYRCEVSADAPSFHTAMKTSYMHVVELPDAAPTITADKSRVISGDTLRVRCTAPPAYPPANLTWLLNDTPIKGLSLDLDPPLQPSDNLKKPMSTVAYRFTSNDTNSTISGFADIEPGSVRIKKNVAENELDIQDKSDGSEESLKAGFKKDGDGEGRKLGADPSSAPVEKAVKRSSGSSLVLHVKQDSFQLGRLVLTCRATVFSVYKAQAHLRYEGEKPRLSPVTGTRESSSGSIPAKRVSLLIYLTLLYSTNALR